MWKIALLVLFFIILFWYFRREYFSDNISNGVYYNDKLTDADMASDNFKIQYQIRGLVNITSDQQSKIINTVKQVVAKLERTLKSTKFPTISQKVPITYNGQKMVKDFYLVVDIFGGQMLEESGEVSDDTVGDTLIDEQRSRMQDGRTVVFPTYSLVRLNRAIILDDIEFVYDTSKYPYAVNRNRMYYLLLHETLHALGVGFLWTLPEWDGPQADYDRKWIAQVDTNPVYIGPSLAKYNNLSATVFYYNQFIGKPGAFQSMPIEDSGGEGTKLWHWEQGYYTQDDQVISTDTREIKGNKAPGLISEIMVGWGLPSVAPVISAITIGNLEDLGYRVNYGEAEVSSLAQIKGEAPLIIKEIKAEIPSDGGDAVVTQVISKVEEPVPVHKIVQVDEGDEGVDEEDEWADEEDEWADDEDEWADEEDEWIDEADDFGSITTQPTPTSEPKSVAPVQTIAPISEPKSVVPLQTIAPISEPKSSAPFVTKVKIPSQVQPIKVVVSKKSVVLPKPYEDKTAKKLTLAILGTGMLTAVLFA